MSCPMRSVVERQAVDSAGAPAQPGNPPPSRVPHHGARNVSIDATTPFVYSSSERCPGCNQKLYASLSSRRRGSHGDDGRRGCVRDSAAFALPVSCAPATRPPAAAADSSADATTAASARDRTSRTGRAEPLAGRRRGVRKTAVRRGDAVTPPLN